MFTLQEALEAIKNKPEFTVREREFGTNIDYNVMMKDSFVGETHAQTLILKNLRGTCFGHNGEIIRLAFDKFHNLNECDGWREADIDFTAEHVVLEKLDGSMITPIYFDGTYRLGTRAGITDVSLKAEAFLDIQPEQIQKAYAHYIIDMQKINCTPIFEYCARDQRIVIDYEVPRLVLVAVRNMHTGKYVPFHHLKFIAGERGLSVIQKFMDEESSLAELVSKTAALIGTEGVVMTFASGHRVKIKGSDYVLKHRALDGLRFEKDVLALILSGGLDDVLPLVGDDVAARLVAYRESVMINLIHATTALHNAFERFMVGAPDKKTFALRVKDSVNSSGLFKLYDGKAYSLLDFAATKCGSQTATESIRWLIGKSYLEF